MIPTIVLPPLRPTCRLTVVVPARDEEANIGDCIAALGAQRELHSFDVVVLTNNCNDATAERARSAGRRRPDLQLHVVDVVLPAALAHVGVARRAVLDAAAERFRVASRPDGVLATTDADTCVASDWVEQTQREIDCGVDAVAGFVEIKPSDPLLTDPQFRKLNAFDAAFRAAIAEVEALIDPRPEDPWPRHGAFVAASFAVTARTYFRAGGLPAIPALEDRRFMEALRRIDARVRFSLRVRAWTSARRRARVEGGFATFVNHLYGQGLRSRTFDVEHPDGVLAALYARAALRKIREGRDTETDATTASTYVRRSIDECRTVLSGDPSFGSACERLMECAGLADPPEVPVEIATARYRREIAELRSRSAAQVQ